MTTLVFSEFGRRVDENGSAGTDHGAGGPVMLAGRVGSRAAGRRRSPAWARPGSTRGNLKVPTDFRSVYQR